VSRTYREVEEPIYELASTVDLTADLAFELLDGKAKDKTHEGEDTIIRMNTRKYSQLLFAIDEVDGMAMDLSKIFQDT
jgi:hypothetical protein